MRIVVGESVLLSESLTPYESLRAFFEVADERDHNAPSVLVDEDGDPLTHPDYVDRMGSPHRAAGAWAFCRRPAAEAFGLPAGTDWVRETSPELMFEAGSPYLPRPHLQDQLYVQRIEEDTPFLLEPLSSATSATWNNEGSRICVLETRLGHVADGTHMAGYLLWEYKLALGGRRLIASFPADARLDFSQISYSSDDSWIHLCRWWPDGSNFLVRVSDGLLVPLPVTSMAMGWNPRNGPTAMVAMTEEGNADRVIIYDYDVATNTLDRRSDIPYPIGLPLSVRELAMSADGCSALVTAAVGVSSLEHEVRGGVQVAAVINIDDGSIDPVLPVPFHTRYAQRRHTSPRWCGEQSLPNGSTGVVIADQLMQNASRISCERDSSAVEEDLLRRSSEILEGIAAAWSSGRMPPGRFADEYLQHALTCYQIDERAADHAVAALRLLARGNRAARTVIRAIDRYRLDQWRPTESTPQPAAAVLPAAIARGIADGGVTEPAGDLAARAELLIVAESLDAATEAGRALAQTAGTSRGEDPWLNLARASNDALERGNLSLVAKIGLATVLWHEYYRSALAVSGLLRTPEPALLSILLNCFEACTHLAEREVVGGSEQRIFDVEDTRKRCQQALGGLPVADYLNTTHRKRAHADRGQRQGRRGLSHVGRNEPRPTDEAATGNTSVATATASTVTGDWDFFVSYTSADSNWAEWIAWELERGGYRVLFQGWDFVPGSHWVTLIQEGVVQATRTLAVLSRAYLASVYGQQEWEAAFRADPAGLARKLIPVRVEDCERPGLLGGVVSFDLFNSPIDVAGQLLLSKVRESIEGRAKPASAPRLPADLQRDGPPGAGREPRRTRY